jgi:hypothetical protein
MKASSIQGGVKSHNPVIRPIIGTILILLIPLVAMQFSDEVRWELPDFIIIGILLISAGLAYELIVARLRDSGQRIIVGIVILLAVMYVWAELAVGIFTNIGS